MRVAVPDHPVPAGPLAVRWLAYELPPVRAGVVAVANVELENAGSATWDSREGFGVCLGYHWLDPLGNPVVWDGVLTAFPHVVAPGERIVAAMTVAGPIPPGRYRLALDLVDSGRCWFAEVGNRAPELDVAVAQRLDARGLAVEIVDGSAELRALTDHALAAQEEAVREDGRAVAFLAPGCAPRPDWSRRLLDAHEEGYAAVGGSLAVVGHWRSRRRFAGALAPWAAGSGRRPGWSLPIVCPSLVRELVPRVRWLDGPGELPAVYPPEFLTDPYVWDGRISMTVEATALRRVDRPRA